MILRIALAVGALATFGVATSASARDLAVAIREDDAGPAVATTLEDTAVRPFIAASGIIATVVPWQGSLDVARSHASDWDLTAIDAGDAQLGCDQGLFEKLDASQIGGRDHYLPLGGNDCAVGAYAKAIVLAWDSGKLPNPPTWTDFWDVAKIPGKRGLRRSPRGNLEIALLADGVAPGDVYRSLRTSDGVARAFRKLDQLKPYLVFWSTGAEAAKILGSGDVLMSSAPNGAVSVANGDGHHAFAVQWAGNLTSIESWAVFKGSANAPAALKFLAFFGDPKLQARLPAAAGLGGLAKGANDGLSAEQKAMSPSLQANLDKGLVVDDAFWRENRDKLAQQFDAWLSR